MQQAGAASQQGSPQAPEMYVLDAVCFFIYMPAIDRSPLNNDCRYMAACAALSEAARLLAGTTTLGTKLANVYYHMAVCDVNGPFSPAPNAEIYCTEGIKHLHATKLPMLTQLKQPHCVHLIYEVRGKVRHSKGDLDGAKSDFMWVAKESPSHPTGGPPGINAEMYYNNLLRDGQLLTGKYSLHKQCPPQLDFRFYFVSESACDSSHGSRSWRGADACRGLPQRALHSHPWLVVRPSAANRPPQ